MNTFTSQNEMDSRKALDYLMTVTARRGFNQDTFTEEELKVMFGDGTRWTSLTFKGFVAVYKCYLEALAL